MTRVVLTGYSRGIGLATARELARRGIELTLVGRTGEQQARAFEELSTLDAPLDHVECDLDAPAAVHRAVDMILRRGTPDAVIHNAGVIERASVEAVSDDSFFRQMRINLWAPFAFTRGLLPAMRRAKQGRIVFVSSISATLGTAGASVYCASKWALSGFMKSLAEELKDSGLMTVAVLPGSVDTEMLRGSGFPPRLDARDVAKTLVHYALDAPTAHNGALIEMFGV